MDEITQNPPVQNPSVYKTLFFLLLFIVTVSVIGGAFYFLGRQQTVKPELTLTPSVTPIREIVFPPYDAGSPPLQEEQAVVDEDVVPVGPNTVRFARIKQNNYFI